LGVTEFYWVKETEFFIERLGYWLARDSSMIAKVMIKEVILFIKVLPVLFEEEENTSR